MHILCCVCWPQLRDFLGARADTGVVAQLLKEQHLPYKVAPVPERGTVAFTPAKGEEYTIEEAVVSGGLTHCSQLTSKRWKAAWKGALELHYGLRRQVS